MAHVKVTAPPDGKAWGTEIEVNGRRLTEVREAVLRFPCDGMVELHVEQSVTSDYEYTGEADVHLHLHLPEGCKLIETTTMSSEGKERLVVRVQAKGY